MLKQNAITVDELTRIARQDESPTVEFKKSTQEKDRACRTLCAFANGQGGKLFFGITPADKLAGQQVTDRTLDKTLSQNGPGRLRRLAQGWRLSRHPTALWQPSNRLKP
jgi:predicted HTH transcriptional regulator